MKNYLKISKRKVKRFILAGLVPVLSVFSIVFSNFLAVQVKANSLSNDSFQSWVVVGSSSTGDNTLGVGTVSCSVGSYNFNVPFSTYAVYNDRYSFSDNTGTLPDAWQEGIHKWYYMYNYDLSEVVSARIIFPSSFLGKVINGVVSVTFTLNNGDTDGYPQLYYKSNTRYTFPFLNSTDSRIGLTNLQDTYNSWTLSTDFSADGVIASLSPSSTNRYYTLNVSFNDYYVPIATSGNTTVGILDIPMNFHFTGALSCGGTTQYPYSTRDFPPFISSMILPVNPYNDPSTSWRCNISGAHFLLDNDYYTLLHALADSQFLTTEASDVALLKNLLASWLGSSDPSSIPVNFADFATSLLSYISQIKNGMLSQSDIRSITTSLNDLVTLQGSQVDLLQNILDLLSDWELSSLQSELISGTADDLGDAVDEEHQIFSNSLNTFKSQLGLIIDTYGDIDFTDYGYQAESFITLLEDFMWELGPLYLVVAVVLLGGILLRIFGRLR